MLTSIKEVFEQYENVNIRRISEATNIHYNLLLKASKTPRAGEVYDPTQKNYEKIDETLKRHEVDINQIDWEALNVEKRVRTAKQFEDFEVGQQVWLRENNEKPFNIIYKTDTHVVIMLEDTTEPRALSANTFLLKGPAFQQREKEEVTK